MNLDEIIDRKETNSVKWEHMAFTDPRVNSGTLPFCVQDMDFACPEPVINALRSRRPDPARGRLSLREPNPLLITATQAAFKSGGPWQRRMSLYFRHA